MSASRPRVAFFTPLPPVQSGIAQYSAELLPLLGEALEIDVFVDDRRGGASLGQARVHPARQFERRQRARPYDLTIYQLGNSPAHAYMWPLIARYPGLLVLHDVVLHHLNVWMAVNQRQALRYRRVMAARYGEAGADVALKTMRGQMPGRVFDMPLCEEPVEASLVVAVHNQFAAGRVREVTGRADIQVIPMGVPLYRLPDKRAARRRLGLSSDEPVVASLGEMSPHKRLDVALRAFSRVRGTRPRAMFVIAGKESPGLNLARQVGMLALEDNVRRLGYLPEASVPDLLAAADVVVNLRYPTAGETSASLLRILAAGKAVVVTRAGAMQEVPPGACVHIAADAAEEDLLAEVMLRLLEDAPLRQGMEAAARRFIERAHTLPHAARAYLDIIGGLIGVDLPTPAWKAPIIDARQGGDILASELPQVAALPHPLADDVADALVDLRLDRVAPLLRGVAVALAELNLGPTATMAGDPPDRR